MEYTKYCTQGPLDARSANALGYIPARIFIDRLELDNVSIVDDVNGYVEVFLSDKTGEISLFGKEDGQEDLQVVYCKMYGEVVYIPNGEQVPEELSDRPKYALSLAKKK